VITPTRIIFKGSGFYATDNRSSSGTSPRAGKSDKSETKPAPAEKGTETKSSEKSE
jgi:predicted nucleic acid-binding Zn ribbon protein